MNDDRVEGQSLYTDRGSGWEVVSDQWEGRGGGEVGAVSRHQVRSQLEETALFCATGGGVNGVFRRK